MSLNDKLSEALKRPAQPLRDAPLGPFEWGNIISFMERKTPESKLVATFYIITDCRYPGWFGQDIKPRIKRLQESSYLYPTFSERVSNCLNVIYQGCPIVILQVAQALFNPETCPIITVAPVGLPTDDELSIAGNVTRYPGQKGLLLRRALGEHLDTKRVRADSKFINTASYYDNVYGYPDPAQPL